MSPSSKPPRDHHIIPRFYPEGFARPDPSMRNPAIWVYEKDKAIRSSTPTHEARERDYYAIEGGEQFDYRFEFFLSQVEDLAAPIFKKLENPNHFFNLDEKVFISYFAALMFARVRPLREFLDKLSERAIRQVGLDLARDKEQFEASCREFQSKTGKKFDIETLREFVLSGNYQITQESAGFNLRHVLQVSWEIGSIFMNKKWLLLRSEINRYFVTSDNPVCSVQPDSDGRALIGVGFGLKGVDVLFPLKPNVCLVMRDEGKDEIGVPDPSYIGNCNSAVMRLAQRNLYAARRSENLDKQFQKIGCTSIYGKTAMVPSTGAIL